MAPDSPADFRLTPVQTRVLSHLSNILDRPEDTLDLGCSFVAHGGSSLDAIALRQRCANDGIALRVRDLLVNKSLLGAIRALRLVGQNDLEHVLREAADFRTDTSRFGTMGAHDRPQSRKGRARKRSSCCLDRPQFRLAANKRPRLVAEAASKRPKMTGYPMTEMQTMFVRSSETSRAGVIRFIETYDLSHLPALRQAWADTIRHEPSLRVRACLEEGKERFEVQETPNFLWKEVYTDNELAHRREVEALAESNFIGTSFKAVALNNDHDGVPTVTIIWSIHHALIDGYSASLIYNRFRQALNGKEAPSPSSSYASVAQALQRLQQQQTAQSRQFWASQQKQSQNAMKKISLPKPLGTPADIDGLPRSESFSINMDDVYALCRTISCTPPAFFCACWAIVLSRYSASYSVSFGLVFSGRDLPIAGADTAIGPLINTLPLHINLDENTSLPALVQSVFKEIVTLRDFQYSRAQDGFRRDFDSVLAMEYDMSPDDDASIKPLFQSELRVTSDVPFGIYVFGNGHVHLDYHSSRFRKEDVTLLAKHFKAVLSARPDSRATVGNILDDFLVPHCSDKLRANSNLGAVTTLPDGSGDNLVSLFARAASAQPDSIAVERGSTRRSYRQLLESAQQVATQLESVVKPGDFVAVHADRSVNWIIAVYGVLAVGGVYVPLDPSLPPFAREQRAAALGRCTFLCSSAEQELLRPPSCSTSFSVETLLQDTVHGNMKFPVRTIPANSPAYVCFTSGSTGQPKPVLCTHQGLVAFQRTLEVRLNAQPRARITQLMSPAFDGSIHEIFSALSYGATLLLPENDPVKHLETATSALMTPTLASVLDPATFPHLKSVYLVGEPVSQQLCDRWAVNGIELFNMYGPTEATCGATIARLQPSKPVTIGRPNPSSRVYILDEKLRLLPPGVTGQIFLAGVQVSCGYLNNPEKTAEVFKKDPFYPGTTEMMYQTGDYGHWTPAGEINCIGRRDRQVKLRGFRLDLNNIENQIVDTVPEVEAAAVARQGNHLVVLVRPVTVDCVAVRGLLVKVLQPQAVPRYIAAVEAFPQTVVGKIDYPAVAAFEFQRDPMCAHLVRPNNKIEGQIKRIWRDILSLPEDTKLDPFANFFALGGHSIAQIALARRINKDLDESVSLKAVFDITAQGTLRDLARIVEASSAASIQDTTSLVKPGEELGADRLAPTEMMWFFRYLHDDCTAQFNVSLAWELGQDIDRGLLCRSWNTVLARHDILRSRYLLSGDGAIERRYALETPVVQTADSIDLQAELDRPFKLDSEPLIRIHLTPRHLLLSASHILCDATAVQVLLRETTQLYHNHVLGPVDRNFAQTTCWFTEPSQENLHFWAVKLDKILRRRGAFDEANYPQPSCKGSSLTFSLGHVLSAQIDRVCRARGITHHQLAMTAVAAALRDLPGSGSQDDQLLFGAPYVNRSAVDTDVVGLFLEPLPLVIPQHYSSKSVTGLIPAIQFASRESLSHALPWSSILCHFDRTPASPDFWLFDAVVSFHSGEQRPELGVEGLRGLATWSTGAKFRLMCEFTRLGNGNVVLRIEFAQEAWSPDQAREIGERVVRAIERLGVEVEGKSTGRRWESSECEVSLGDILEEFGGNEGSSE